MIVTWRRADENAPMRCLRCHGYSDTGIEVLIYSLNRSAILQRADLPLLLALSPRLYMALHVIEGNDIRSLKPVSFEKVNLTERGDLQRLLRDRIDIIMEDDDGMVIAEEFGRWEDSARRIDLLVLDKEANLVVVELKRTDGGGHMELQAVRYAAMVSTMTFAQAVEAHEEYLRNRGSTDNAKDVLLQFLGWEEDTDKRFAEAVSIVLVSADFSKEITTTALWLNERGLDIRCVRLKPYEMDSRVVLDVQQLIPLPEAQDYIIQVGIKQREAQAYVRRSRWNLSEFMGELRKHCEEEIVQLAHTIHDWVVEEFGSVHFGQGEALGTFGATLAHDGSEARVFVVRSDGRFTIRFMHLKTRSWIKDRAVLTEFRDRLNKIDGMKLTEKDLDGKPKKSLDLLLDPANLGCFKDAVKWLKDKALSTV